MMEEVCVGSKPSEWGWCLPKYYVMTLEKPTFIILMSVFRLFMRLSIYLSL